MVQYLVILLDDTAVSFCHYPARDTARRLMPLAMLREGIRYGMRENLNIQMVYPDYALPEEYETVIDSIDHIKIKPYGQHDDADVVIMDDVGDITEDSAQTFVLRITKAVFFREIDRVCALVTRTKRLNIVLTDVATCTEDDFSKYKTCLATLADKIEEQYVAGLSPQVNLLTDRIMLDAMNNCGAGETNITLAPDGCFYVCPAFYSSADGYDIGNLREGVAIKNAQLYRLDHAPLCRQCDAYQCRRCVWLNRKTTYEVNTPSHEQCVVAHIERNASRALLATIRQHGTFLPEREIKEIDYLDPFEVRKEW